MKLRHAAALALVGWYLVLPSSVAPSANPNLWVGSPYAVKGPFSTAEGCDLAQRSLEGQGLRHSLDWPRDQSSRGFQSSVRAKCMSEGEFQSWKKLAEKYAATHPQLKPN